MYWLLLKGEAVSSGVDALTITSNTTDANNRVSAMSIISELALIMSEYEYSDGKVKKLSNFNNGIKGWIIGSVRYGAKRDSYGRTQFNMMQITGELSRIAILKLLSMNTDTGKEAAKVTRVDLYMDVVQAKPSVNWASEVYERMPERTKVHSKLILSPTGSTLYINERTSPVYARVYDKSDCYGFEIGKGAVIRYEIEIKEEKAMRLYKSILDAKYNEHGLPSFCRDAVSQWFSKKNIPVSTTGSPEVWKLPQLGLRTDYAETRINYVLSQMDVIARYVRDYPYLASAVRYGIDGIQGELNASTAKVLDKIK